MAIESQIDLNEERLITATEEALAAALVLIATLDVVNGRIVNDQLNVDRADALRGRFTDSLLPYFSSVDEVVTSFASVGPNIREDFKSADVDIEFNDQDVKILTAVSGNVRLSLRALGNKTASDIGTIVYNGTISGDTIENVNKTVEQLLIGNTGKPGRSLSHVAATEAETAIMEFNAIMTRRKGDEIGIQKYGYAGSLIKDSRQWCIDHVNRDYTLEEIEEWGPQLWQGKKPGNPFVTRGGWRCRHRWIPKTQ